ncbi:outer membrane beta-barrel protein [Spirosoma sp. HMF3257]|uniref:PorT family protein n=1 Tax=Spirosoma telluris TaxID=2183553 RepID=A0A327NFB3_9BACT|nr:outer membrane beta-barrel protein [Spirosoma telluris]RAI73991.1 PorT family protein [Spirosoma telluris]
MKNTLCTVLLVLIQFSVNAQTEKGRWNAGVSVGQFSYQKADLGNFFSGSLTPTAGYFVAPNLLLGAGIPLSYNTQRYLSPVVNQKTRSFTVGVSPFARYYIGAAKLKPNIGFSFSYSHNNYYSTGSTNSSSLESVATTNAITITPSVGLAYFLSQSISLDARLNYNWYKSMLRDGSTRDTGFADTYQNTTLGIGFNIFFGG